MALSHRALFVFRGGNQPWRVKWWLMTMATDDMSGFFPLCYLHHVSHGLWFTGTVCFSGEYSELLLCTAEGQGTACYLFVCWGTSIWAETIGSSLLLMIWPGGNVFIVFIMKITNMTEQSRSSTWDHSPCGYLIGLVQYTSDVIETLYVWLIFARWYLCIFLLKIK